MRTAALGVLALVLLAGCSSSGRPGGADVVTVTRTRTPPATHTSTTRAPSTSAHPAPTHQARLPGTCDDLLPDGDVVAAIHQPRLAGTDAFVVGVPEKDIGRIGYLNCRYGVTGKGASATPKVEIGISLYRTPAEAAKRITATVGDYSAHGARSSSVQVGTQAGTLLAGGSGTGYDVPLLVVGSGQRTVAVSVAPSVATGDKATSDAVALAGLALQRTAG